MFNTVHNGPIEDPGSFIGFIRKHADGFEAFDADKILLGVFADATDAANTIWFNCLGGRASPPDSQLDSVRAQAIIEITELEPSNGAFVGKQIGVDGSITGYPKYLKWWRQSVAQVPATIPHLFAYLREARTRNVCLIRDAPANLERQPTLRQMAGIGDRGDHGFTDTPTRLFPLDFDGVQIKWRADPEAAIRAIVAMLGEPWASTSFVWFFSATHGLEFKDHECPTTGKKHKRWTGRIIDGVVRVRIIFIAERALDAGEAKALATTAKALVPEIDTSMMDRVHINYIRRPLWIEHPDRDVLGDIPTIGWIKGTHDTLVVPDNLAHTARWAKAQGHGSSIADHPDAESAVRGIGSDGEVRSHLRSAVIQLLIANPVSDVASFADHGIAITNQLQRMVKQHRAEIEKNLAQHNRHWSDVLQYLPDNMADWTDWCLNHPGILRARTIKLIREEQAEASGTKTAEETFTRVAHTIKQACDAALANEGLENPPVTLLVSPTGSRKSTLIRAAAVRYVTERPNRTVVILMPRHRLSDEQIEMLQREHPGNQRPAVWRGRHAWDPHIGNGAEEKMCPRSEEAKEVEKAMLDVESSLCKRGRGAKAVKCPFYDTCAYQRQKRVKANIWFAAHECAVHEMPVTFGDVGWVIFDESPLDAFMFGVDTDDQVTLELDILSTPIAGDRARFGGHYKGLMRTRKALYDTLDGLQVPIESQQGAAASRESLKRFIGPPHGGNDIYARDMPRLWGGKVEPDIRPDTPTEQLKTKLQEAAGNGTIKKEVTLWGLVQLAGHDAFDAAVDAAIEKGVEPEELIRIIETAIISDGLYGRIQVQRGKEGRIIRMVGLKPLIKGTQPAKRAKRAERAQGEQDLELIFNPTRPQPEKAKPLANGKRRTKGWNVPTLICDATGDAELLKAIWPQLEEPEPHGWEQLPRPENVRIFQCVDKPMSKSAVAVEGKNEQELARKAAAARRLYAAVLMKAVKYGGGDVGVIAYKSTVNWIEKNCFVPDWLKLMHWGDFTGTNALQKVRALFVIGRPLASAEAVTRQAEALFGDHIAERGYRKQPKGGRIPIAADAGGNNTVLVDVWEHSHPLGERLRRQITEGGLIQAVGRPRAGLREAGEPLDIHLWTDVPIPELGPVEPVLWSELEAGLDWLMLTAAGVWLRNIADAVRAFPGLFSARGLKEARGRMGGVDVFPIGYPIGKVATPPIFRVVYRRAAAGCKSAEAVFFQGVSNPRGWLEARLGPLAYFEIKAQAA